MLVQYRLQWWQVAISVVGLLVVGAEFAAAKLVLNGQIAVQTTRRSTAAIDQLRDNRQAFDLYMLHCGGCHRANGGGAPNYGVPSFVHSAGMFTWIPAGREYLIRVPGSASSTLTDSQLAEVMNWIVATYSPDELPPGFKPYTQAYVASVRDRHYKNVVTARARVDRQLAALGLTPARYTFGKGDAAAGNEKH